MASVGRPEYLRQCVEMSLRRLKLERIDLYQLHRIDPNVPTAEQIGVLAEMRREGKIKHIGLSKVTVAEIIEAQRIAPVVSVQNPYNLLNREFEDVLGYCEQEGLGFIPWFPLDTGRLAGRDGPLAALARNAGLTPVQLALAWLLRRSPVLLPILGTASLAHLEENLASARVELTDEQYAALSSPREAADLELSLARPAACGRQAETFCTPVDAAVFAWYARTGQHLAEIPQRRLVVERQQRRPRQTGRNAQEPQGGLELGVERAPELGVLALVPELRVQGTLLRGQPLRLGDVAAPCGLEHPRQLPAQQFPPADVA